MQRKTAFLGMVAGLLAAAGALAAPKSLAAFRAPAVAPLEVSLPAPVAKSALQTHGDGPVRVGDVRALPKAAPMGQWTRVEGGYVARLRATSIGALGMRIRLDLGAVPGTMFIRAQGNASPRVETMVLDPLLGPDAWTPWTEGETQLIEVFSAVAPAEDAVRAGAVLHFTASPTAKAALSCTLSTACSSGDPVLDNLLDERKRSLMKITVVIGNGGFVCSATLIDTPQRPAAYVLTANHCAQTQQVTRSISAFWFYEESACNGGVQSPSAVQTAGGMQFVFGSYATDTTLLLMSSPPPTGAVHAPLDVTSLPVGAQVVSLSHPAGDLSRWADGTVLGQGRPVDLPYGMYVATFTRGMVQGGSSGSGLFTRGANGLQLAGVLSRGPLDPTCAMPQKIGVYGRMEVVHPQIARYIGAAPGANDDVPNRASDVTTSVSSAPLDNATSPVTASARIDYPGDMDVFRFSLAGSAAVSIQSTGGQDLVSTLSDFNGVGIAANDDAQARSNDTGLTRYLSPGAYHVEIAHWQPGGTGAYGLQFRADRVDRDNHTALWWNPAESGWGINVNHQGNIVFATLFSYDDQGEPMWLVMSRGEKQLDGSYSGALYRTSGPPFNASPWRAVTPVRVGTMRIQFAGANTASLSYSVDGRNVTKSITRQEFATLPECSWSHFDRSIEENMQDLWWNPAESGWGINLAHQDDTVFATLFTYGMDGRGLWLVMSDGKVDANGDVTGTLYRTRGPRFDASPWTSIAATAVGTMRLAFEHGNAATLTYTVDGVSVTRQITRQEFSSPRPRCVN